MFDVLYQIAVEHESSLENTNNHQIDVSFLSHDLIVVLVDLLTH